MGVGIIRILDNLVVRQALISTITDAVGLYSKALLNIITNKINSAGQPKKQKPHFVKVALED